jgi:DNA-binding helix-hairpin-helix protein with protein kinase domain
VSDRFGIGTRIPLTNGDQAVVGGFLGEGGQGAVYRVAMGGKDYALKWYHAGVIKDSKAFYKNLGDNISKGSPTAAFLWPLYLTEQAGGSFGYVMNLRPGNYRDLGDFLLAKARFDSIAAALGACLGIAHGFRELNRKGFSYQDLNDGNFFIDPSSGDVMICDNDNVAPHLESLGIAGKARYMAPEVVRNLQTPDIFTDRFSLAVILFRILFLDHPLEGKRALVPCLTEEMELRFYGREPVFIYDPDDDGNRPVPGVHPNAIRFWPKYPQTIRDTFVKAFAKDAMRADGPRRGPLRVSASDWLIAFTQIRDMLIVCPCDSETFFEQSRDSVKCPHCQIEIPRPSTLSVKRYSVVLFPGKKLYRCHIDNDSSDHEEVCGQVVRNPSNPQIWGLKNLSPERSAPWTAIALDGATKLIAPSETLVIPKTKAIDFGNCSAAVGA